MPASHPRPLFSAALFALACCALFAQSVPPALESPPVRPPQIGPHGEKLPGMPKFHDPAPYDIDEHTGMVIDLGELKQVVAETVVQRFDHADLNADPLFRDRVPTTENLALAVWDLLAPKLGRDRLASVRVWEDATLWAEYDGA